MTVELTVGKVAKIAGVPTDILRRLCEQGHVRARRGSAGNWYMDPADAPDAATVRTIVVQEYRLALQQVEATIRRIEVEVESVKLDCREALEALNADPASRPPALGNDLRSPGRSDTPLGEAVRDLDWNSLEVSLRHRALREMSDPPAPEVGAR